MTTRSKTVLTFLFLLSVVYVAAGPGSQAQGQTAADRAQAFYDRHKGADPVNPSRALTDKIRRQPDPLSQRSTLPALPTEAREESAPERTPKKRRRRVAVTPERTGARAAAAARRDDRAMPEQPATEKRLLSPMESNTAAAVEGRAEPAETRAEKPDTTRKPKASEHRRGSLGERASVSTLPPLVP